MANEIEATSDRVVRAYIRFRDERNAFSRRAEGVIAEYNAKMDRLSAHMLQQMNQTGQTSFRTAYGTVFRQEVVTPQASDWGAIYEFVRANDAWDLLERRLKKTFVAAYAETHDGNPPPGVSVFREFEARVRKPTSKKGEPDYVD